MTLDKSYSIPVAEGWERKEHLLCHAAKIQWNALSK